MYLQENFQLKRYNTFGINASAKYFSVFGSADELEQLLDSNTRNVMILGGGSNILFTKDFDGLVLKNEIGGITAIKEDEEYIYVKAGAGISWHYLVMYCVEHAYGGLENLSLIPGNVGASPMQNIGAYGVEIKDVFNELEAYHLLEKKRYIFTAPECEFAYRESIFKKKYKGTFAILNVTFRLRKNPVFNVTYGALEQELEKMQVAALNIKSISEAVINIRTSKLPDPAVIGNAGSFFKNPEIDEGVLLQLKIMEAAVPFYKISEQLFKIPAAWLIEQCGWKGYRNGDAGCYEKQPLVLVNYGHAQGSEILHLSRAIQSSVQKKFGILLETEVNII